MMTFKTKMNIWGITIVWIMFYISTLFIPDYHFTHYTDVKIENDVEMVVKKPTGNTTVHKVTFTARDIHGEKKRMQKEFETDYLVGHNDYLDLINSSTYETYNTWQSLITWIPVFVLVILSIILIVDECEEDDDNITQFYRDRVDHWADFKRFMGGDEETIAKVVENEKDHIERNYRYCCWNKPTWQSLNQTYRNYK